MSYNQEYYLKNRAIMIDRQTAYYQQHREKYLAYMKEYNKQYYASHYVPKPRKIKEPKPKKVREPKPPKEKKPRKPCVTVKKAPPQMHIETGQFILSFFD